MRSHDDITINILMVQNVFSRQLLVPILNAFGFELPVIKHEVANFGVGKKQGSCNVQTNYVLHKHFSLWQTREVTSYTCLGTKYSATC
jgi:hypothetical protein